VGLQVGNHAYLHVAKTAPASMMESLVLPLNEGRDRCKFFIGNRLHEVLNTVVVAGLFDLPLHRERNVLYTCDGLLDSTGVYESYNVTRFRSNPPGGWCSPAGRSRLDLEGAIAQGILRVYARPYALKNCETNARCTDRM